MVVHFYLGCPITFRGAIDFAKEVFFVIIFFYFMYFVCAVLLAAVDFVAIVAGEMFGWT